MRVDGLLLRRVQEGQPAGGADGDAQPEAPRQRRLHGGSALWLMMHRKTKELSLVHRHILNLTSEQSTTIRRLACADNATDRPSMCHSPQHKDLVFFSIVIDRHLMIELVVHYRSRSTYCVARFGRGGSPGCPWPCTRTPAGAPCPPSSNPAASPDWGAKASPGNSPPTAPPITFIYFSNDGF